MEMITATTSRTIATAEKEIIKLKALSATAGVAALSDALPNFLAKNKNRITQAKIKPITI
jgi:hypothetical protein